MTASQIVSYVFNVLLGACAGLFFTLWRIYYKRYIDTLNEQGPLIIGRDWLVKEHRKDASTIRAYEAEIEKLRTLTSGMKSGESVSVARCKDCKFCKAGDYIAIYDSYCCERFECFIKPEDYCSYAEKKEDSDGD